MVGQFDRGTDQESREVRQVAIDVRQVSAP